jgi:hypothetical protein
MTANDEQPEEGDFIAVAGGTRAVEGRVVAVNDDTLVVLEAPGRIVYLRRNFASTDPRRWWIAGRPAAVRIVTRAETPARRQKDADFAQRLSELERKTRYY